MPLAAKFHHNQLPAMPPFGDHAGYGQRSVGREGGRNHRSPGEPPRDVAAREEELIDAFAGARAIVQPDAEIEQEVQGDDGPIDGRKLH